MRMRGYTFSRPFFGERVPQSVQNLVIREHCKSQNMQYLLSAVEYAIDGSDLILRQLLNEIDRVNGIVFYSFLQLPEDVNLRSLMWQMALNYKKYFCFALENINIKNECDIANTEMMLSIKKIDTDIHSLNGLT
jgi:sporadic carbohydrate cluster protein (TIGR04323 family)